MHDAAAATPTPVPSRVLRAAAWTYGVLSVCALAWLLAPHPGAAEEPHGGLGYDRTRLLAAWLFAYGLGLAASTWRIAPRGAAILAVDALVLSHAALGLVATAGSMARDLGEGAVRDLGGRVWGATGDSAMYAVFFGWIVALGQVLTSRRAWAYFLVCLLAPLVLGLLVIR